MLFSENSTVSKRPADLLASVFVKRTDSVLTQIFRFAIVGAIATVADSSALFILKHYLGISYMISAAFGFILGVTISYIISIRWVFANRSVGSASVELAAFLVIGLIGLGFTELIMYESVESWHMHYMTGKLIAVVIVFGWNFGARRIILFRRKAEK